VERLEERLVERLVEHLMEEGRRHREERRAALPGVWGVDREALLEARPERERVRHLIEWETCL